MANKQNSGLIRSRFLEEGARHLAESGNFLEETKINHLISTEKNKERARRLITLKPRISGTGVGRFEIQNEESSESENITYTEVVKKEYLERESMKEIS